MAQKSLNFLFTTKMVQAQKSLKFMNSGSELFALFSAKSATSDICQVGFAHLPHPYDSKTRPLIRGPSLLLLGILARRKKNKSSRAPAASSPHRASAEPGARGWRCSSYPGQVAMELIFQRNQETLTYPLKLQALGKLIFYRHIANVTTQKLKSCAFKR